MPPTASSAVTSSDVLPNEQSLVVVQGGTKARPTQSFSASLYTALYLGFQCAIEPRHVAINESRHVLITSDMQNSSSLIQETSSSRAVLDALNFQAPDELYDGMTLQLGVQIATCLQQYGDA